MKIRRQGAGTWHDGNLEEHGMEIDRETAKARGRQLKAGGRKALIKIIEYIDEADFHKLTAFQAGYEAGRRSGILQAQKES